MGFCVWREDGAASNLSGERGAWLVWGRASVYFVRRRMGRRRSAGRYILSRLPVCFNLAGRTGQAGVFDTAGHFAIDAVKEDVGVSRSCERM